MSLILPSVRDWLRICCTMALFGVTVHIPPSMNLTTLLKLASTSLDAQRGGASTSNLVFAEVDPDGKLVTVNPLAKMKWGWQAGSSVQGEVKIALEGLVGSKATDLPFKLGGLHIGAIAREKNVGWLVFGYDPDDPDANSEVVQKEIMQEIIDREPEWRHTANSQTSQKTTKNKKRSLARLSLADKVDPPERRGDAEQQVQSALNTLRLLATTSPDYAVFCDSAMQTIANALEAERVVLMVRDGEGHLIPGPASWNDDHSGVHSLVQKERENLVLDENHPFLQHVEARRSAMMMNRAIAPVICSQLNCTNAVVAAVHDQGQLTGYMIVFLKEERAGENLNFESLLKRADQLVAVFETLYTWISMISSYRTIVSTVEDVIFSFRVGANASRQYGYISDRVEHIAGYRPHELSGVQNPSYSWIENIVHEDDRDMLRAKTATLRAGEQTDVNYRIIHRNGSTRWIQEHACLNTDAIGVQNVAGVLKDVTEVKAVEEMVADAREDVEASRRSKTAFIATMSHEVRTPLGAMSGYAQLLQKELTDYEQLTGNELPEQIHEFANVLTNRSYKLQSLVHDLFELSNLEMGGAVLQKEHIALHSVIKKSAAKFSEVLQQKGVSLLMTFCSEDPVIISDAHCLEQILDNVLSNATKFTENGSVTVQTAVRDGKAVIEVQDTGIGISEHFQKELFEAFSQEEDWRNRKFGGTGMGLALSRRLLDLLDGQIEVESEKGLGSTFRVLLPLATT